MSIKNKMGYINMEGANNKSTDNDCIICFDAVSEKKSFIKCHNCFKVYHFDCFNTWICKFKKEKAIICPYCQQTDIMLYKIDKPCCFSFFKKRKKKETSVRVYSLTFSSNGNNRIKNS